MVEKGLGGKGAKRVRNLSLPMGAEEQAPMGFPDKLLKAAIAFVGKSLKLHTVIVDSVKIRIELLASLGEALSTSKSGATMFLLPNVYAAFASEELRVR